jgi:hypothetical protein
MRRTPKLKLCVKTETIKRLDAVKLQHVAGAGPYSNACPGKTTTGNG